MQLKSIGAPMWAHINIKIVVSTQKLPGVKESHSSAINSLHGIA